MKIKLTATHINSLSIPKEISATGTGDAVIAHDRARKKLVKEVYEHYPETMNIRYYASKEMHTEQDTDWKFLGEYSG